MSPYRHHKGTVEFACIEAVARAVGCKAVAEADANGWPDGWLEHADGRRQSVEVVQAFRRPRGEDPKLGSAAQRNWVLGSRESEALAKKAGQPVSFHATEDGFMLLDGTTPLPLATEPVRQDEWVVAAIQQKLAKNYASVHPATLIVNLKSPLALLPFEVERISSVVAGLGDEFTFADLWVVNDFGDAPIRIPLAQVGSRDGAVAPLEPGGA